MSSLDSLLNIHYTVDGMKKDEICFSLNKQLSPWFGKGGLPYYEEKYAYLLAFQYMVLQ